MNNNTIISTSEFDDDDLKANRTGQLSQRQIDELQRDRKTVTLILVIGLSLFGSGLIYTLTAWLSNPERTYSRLFLIGAGVAFAIWFSISHAAGWRKVTDDIKQGQATIYRGIVLRLPAKNPGSPYLLVAGDVELRVRRNIFDALHDDQPYCVYYTPHTRLFLAAEPCPNDEQ